MTKIIEASKIVVLYRTPLTYRLVEVRDDLIESFGPDAEIAPRLRAYVKRIEQGVVQHSPILGT